MNGWPEYFISFLFTPFPNVIPAVSLSVPCIPLCSSRMASLPWPLLSSRATTQWSPCCWSTTLKEKSASQRCTSQRVKMTQSRPRCCSRTITTLMSSLRWGRGAGEIDRWTGVLHEMEKRWEALITKRERDTGTGCAMRHLTKHVILDWSWKSTGLFTLQIIYVPIYWPIDNFWRCFSS